MLRALPLLLLPACLTPVESDLCEKFDECNALVGQSVSECADVWSELLDDLSESDREDCESDLEDCMREDSCEDFLTCEVRCEDVDRGGGGPFGGGCRAAGPGTTGGTTGGTTAGATTTGGTTGGATAGTGGGGCR